jgi:hypothetical protein
MNREYTTTPPIAPGTYYARRRGLTGVYTEVLVQVVSVPWPGGLVVLWPGKDPRYGDWRRLDSYERGPAGEVVWNRFPVEWAVV